MSQVRNLRAMFEQKGDTSPPENRGRSPGVASTGAESPRPLSKVRTNFIAVEKDGRIGLQRDPSRESSVSVSTRRLSGEQEGITPPPIPRDKSITSTEKIEKTPAKTSLKEQPIPESPRTDSGSQITAKFPPANMSAPEALAPPSNPDHVLDVEETNLTMAPGDTTAGPAVSTNGAVLPNGGSAEVVNATGGSGSRDKGKGKAVSKDASPYNAAGPSKPVTLRTAPIVTTAKTAVKPAKSPTVAKPLKSPAAIAATPKLPAKTPEKKAAHAEKTATPKAPASTAKPAASSSNPSSVKKPPPLQPSPSSAGVVKPKVKSPTRPVKLPSGLTTHTAASVSKLNNPRPSTSQASGSLHPHEPLGRSPSRASVSTIATTATRQAGTAGKNLRRQSSTINRPRPSLGPPPKQPAKDHPPTKKEREVDESFLARMMRPTQASSSKTTEKAPLTPPRKATAPPGVKKVVPKQDLKVVRKMIVRPGQAVASSSGHAEQSSAQEIAPIVEQVATAEEAVSVAKEVEGSAVLSGDAAEETTTAEDIAPIVEQLESAEKVVEVAKEVEGEPSLPAEPLNEGHSGAEPEAENAAALTNGTHQGNVGEAEDTTVDANSVTRAEITAQ